MNCVTRVILFFRRIGQILNPSNNSCDRLYPHLETLTCRKTYRLMPATLTRSPDFSTDIPFATTESSTTSITNGRKSMRQRLMVWRVTYFAISTQLGSREGIHAEDGRPSFDEVLTAPTVLSKGPGLARCVAKVLIAGIGRAFSWKRSPMATQVQSVVRPEESFRRSPIDARMRLVRRWLEVPSICSPSLTLGIPCEKRESILLQRLFDGLDCPIMAFHQVP